MSALKQDIDTNLLSLVFYSAVDNTIIEISRRNLRPSKLPIIHQIKTDNPFPAISFASISQDLLGKMLQPNHINKRNIHITQTFTPPTTLPLPFLTRLPVI